ncbi:hypothetical protein CYLTODRAFT_426263 [Cylindrobasidium torrendii FP15055 ss-10]|uniref:Histone deacetylase complex subunit SAP30 Sin3 binding domain-containing protein n=1 Tax=Cylindrobasidium torrendii FP15055 ss-10 TaxID=1314674 RepID=A0A0D7AZ62_9AGAR|nr:hypothetical protein CYLTODRAFT_426263 [Cylindrobasidium torrendii FP15055 ss-10]
MSVLSMQSRSRPAPRKKPSDDAAYFGPSTSTLKRPATERPEPDNRVKRKRIDGPGTASGFREPLDMENRISLVEFEKMSTPTLYRYLMTYNIIPTISPSPLGPEDPPSPASLGLPPAGRQPSPAASVASTVRDRDNNAKEKDANNNKDGKDKDVHAARRRSSRLIEDDQPPTRMPIRADVQELHSVLAAIADRHFRDSLSVTSREEVDTLASFMCAVERHKGRMKY